MGQAKKERGWILKRFVAMLRFIIERGEESREPIDLASIDKTVWMDHWRKKGQFWRTEPEIDLERQTYLAERRAILPNPGEGVYPFKNVKLKRADIEWLLDSHESGRLKGPVLLTEAGQTKRKGLYLRGADLQEANLQGLPLAKTDFILANCTRVHFEGADLSQATFAGTNLQGAFFDVTSRLDGTVLSDQINENRDARVGSFGAMFLHELNPLAALARLITLNSNDAMDNFLFTAALLADVNWNNVNLSNINWHPVYMVGEEKKAHTRKGSDGKKKLPSIRLQECQEAIRSNRQVAIALRNQGMDEEANKFAYKAKVLQRIYIWRFFWTMVVWFGMLKIIFLNITSKPVKLLRLGFLFVVALLDLVLLVFPRILFSYFLDLLAGYGYKPIRSFFCYCAVIASFTAAYVKFGSINKRPFTWHEALIFSLTSFHGRGFFPGGLGLDDPITTLAAIEAVVGLLIEICFIATFTQRYFSK